MTHNIIVIKQISKVWVKPCNITQIVRNGTFVYLPFTSMAGYSHVPDYRIFCCYGDMDHLIAIHKLHVNIRSKKTAPEIVALNC